jgi:hypothetical protein
VTPLATGFAVERIAPADRALLQRTLASSGVERTPVPPEGSYLGELLRAVVDALYKAVARGARMVHLPRQVLIAAAFLVAVLALLLALRALLPRLRGARRLLSMETPVVGERREPAPDLDAALWRAELERLLGEGRSAEALEATWWWLARSLAGSRALADWTSRDLVSRTGRRDLAALVRRLDALIYGPHRPAPEEVRGLVDRFEEALA